MLTPMDYSAVQGDMNRWDVANEEEATLGVPTL
jgi:hypothetical protein